MTSALVLGSLQGPSTLRPTHSLARVKLTVPGPGTRTESPTFLPVSLGEGYICKGDSTALFNRA